MNGWLVAAVAGVVVGLVGVWELVARWVVARQLRREAQERERLLRAGPPVLGSPGRARHLRARWRKP